MKCCSCNDITGCVYCDLVVSSVFYYVLYPAAYRAFVDFAVNQYNQSLQRFTNALASNVCSEKAILCSLIHSYSIVLSWKVLLRS
jgi:hypothetical protein